MSSGLTNNDLVFERPHSIGIGGVQRIYRFPYGYGLSAVNAKVLHHYPFAWEIAVLKNVSEDGTFRSITYDTPLTNDVEVFSTNEEANEFIARARKEIGEAA